MPLLTVGYPMERWDTDANVTEIKNVLNETIDQLRYILCNLDAGNVIEAASVKAQNIDVTQAQIKDAQIGSLKADKLWAGTIDSGKVSIKEKDSNKTIDITGSYIHFEENGKDRAGMGYLPDGTFVFYINDPSGQQVQIGLDSDGNAYVRGTVDSSTIYASQIIGATKADAGNLGVDKVFAVVDPAGIGIMQDKNGQRLQKIGMTVDSQGNSILVLGAGNGTRPITINGVTYSDDSFVMLKGEHTTTFYTKGATGGAITFYNDNGTGRVEIDGVNVVEKITKMENDIKNLEQKVAALERGE